VNVVWFSDQGRSEYGRVHHPQSMTGLRDRGGGGTRGAPQQSIELGELDPPKFAGSNWWNAISERVCDGIYSSWFVTGRGLERNLSSSVL